MNKKGKSICIFSPKGGVGKTVLSMNIAGTASLMNKKVLLFDMDLYNGGISMLINSNIEHTIFHLIDDLNNNRYTNIKDYVYSYNEYIDIMPSPKDPRQGNKIESKYLELIINRVTELYDLVIIDTSSFLNDINIVTLDIVDEILFIITNDLIHVKNMKNIINIFRDAQINNYKLLFNSAITNKSLSSLDIEKVIGDKVNYYISKELYFKDINSLIFECTIPILSKGTARKCKNDVKVLKQIIDDIFEGDDLNE